MIAIVPLKQRRKQSKQTSQKLLTLPTTHFPSNHLRLDNTFNLF